MLQESDISWQVLRRIVQEWAGSSAELSEVKPLVGGCINTTLAVITQSNDRAVLKISPHRVNRDLLREANQLKLMRELGLPVPQVYLMNLGSLDNPHTYLLMEHVDGVDLGEAKKLCTMEEFDHLQNELAEVVLKMHSHTAAEYRREHPDDPLRFDSWPRFYRHVYDHIWGDLESSKLLPVKVRKQIGRVHERLDRLLTHDDCPRLVHWDIWATNVLVNKNGDGRWHIKALLDPNCKYAHAEAEIAYMELFHTVTPVFMKAYQRDRRLSDGYHRLRKPIYQLYPLINHVHLFGQEYLKPLLGAVERVSAIV